MQPLAASGQHSKKLRLNDPGSSRNEAHTRSNDQYGSVIVHVGSSRSCYDERVERREEPVAVIVLEQLVCTNFLALRARERVRREESARIIFGAVDTVGVTR